MLKNNTGLPFHMIFPASRTAGGRKNPNQVRSLTSSKMSWKKDFSGYTKKKPQTFV